MTTMLWVLLALTTVGGAAYVLLRQRDTANSGSASQDRYAAEEAISPAHARLLTYLQEAFPGQAVLFRPALSQLVSVRHASDRQRAQQRLASHSVDFVVCSAEGKPEYAFDVRERNTQTDDTARRSNALKARVLKTAGVRLLRIQRSVRDMPSAKLFQQRLIDSLQISPAPAAPLHSHVSTDLLPASARAADSPASDMANLTNLMGLPPVPDPDADNNTHAQDAAQTFARQEHRPA